MRVKKKFVIFLTAIREFKSSKAIFNGAKQITLGWFTVWIEKIT